MSNLPLELAGITGAFVLAGAGLLGAAWMLTAEPDRTVIVPVPPPQVAAEQYRPGSITQRELNDRLDRDIRRAREGHSLGAQAKPPAVVATGDTCRTAWALCADNAKMVQNYRNFLDVQSGCAAAAEKPATYYGTRNLEFAYYKRGNDFPQTGIVVLVDLTSRYSNDAGDGPMVQTRTTCTYDLRQQRVVDLKVE